MKRCKWCNEKNALYVAYHDNIWGVPNFEEQNLFEMLILEGFQAGLSWECVLNKKKDFEIAFEGFDLKKIKNFDEKKVEELCCNNKIIKNKRKILASIKNAKVFEKIQNEFGSFKNYLFGFTHGKIFCECNKTTSPLSDQISFDLKKRGMSFVGSITIYAFLQAVGVINSHEEGCFLHKTSKNS